MRSTNEEIMSAGGQREIGNAGESTGSGCRRQPGNPDADNRDLVSVIVPAYNAEKFVKRTLLSVLNQSYRNLEIIVVDDGSQDGTAGIVDDVARRDDRVCLIRQENSGVGQARNQAIARARGAFIAPIDADDLWHRDKLLLQVDALRGAPPSASVAYCWWLPIDERDIVKSHGYVPFPCQFEGNVFNELAVQNFIGNGSVPLIRSSAVREIGGYDPDRTLQPTADWKLYLQLAERGEFVLVRRALVGYRQFSGGMSTGVVPMERSWNATVRWVRDRHPRLSRATIRRQTYHGRSYHFLLALRSRKTFIRALRYMTIAAANGPFLFSAMLFDRLRTRLHPKRNSDESASFFQAMTGGASKSQRRSELRHTSHRT